jgi:hypothetical protein
MRLTEAFEALEVSEFDDFAFDFSANMGTAAMISTSWTCALAPLQQATDPNPQSRVISAAVQTTIQILKAGVLRPVQGNFSVARIGGMPASAAGGVYILDATANLSDGRILRLNSTVQCVAPGS